MGGAADVPQRLMRERQSVREGKKLKEMR